MRRIPRFEGRPGRPVAVRRPVSGRRSFSRGCSSAVTSESRWSLVGLRRVARDRRWDAFSVFDRGRRRGRGDEPGGQLRRARRRGAAPRERHSADRVGPLASRSSALAAAGSDHHPAVPRLIRTVLAGPRPMIAAAAIRTLGDIGDDWAIDLLLDALRRGEGRARVSRRSSSGSLRHRARASPLLRDWNPDVRFWGATLLRPYPDLGEATLVELTWDPDRERPRSGSSRRSGRRREATSGCAARAARRQRVVRPCPCRPRCRSRRRAQAAPTIDTAPRG